MMQTETLSAPTGKLSRLLRTWSVPAPGDCPSILVVEDTRAVRELLCAHLRRLGVFKVESAGTLDEARTLIAQHPERFFCAALDLNLPDAPNGEIVGEVLARGIPAIVLTATMDDQVRKTMLAKPIVDYVIKGSATQIENVAYVIGRLFENRKTKIIITDDSPSFRQYLDVLLKRYCYQTLLAKNGRETLDLLGEHPDTSLVITDINMPEMDGFELVTAIRAKHNKEDLAVIGISEFSSPGQTVKLLKLGANDYLSKPFEVEEFYCRVTQSTNTVGYVRQIRNFATRDFLTGAFNRRQLFELGANLWANARRGNICVASAVIDADFFKRINDTHGHDVGDQTLKAIAACLADTLRKTDVVARYGGEEFVCLAVVKAPEDARIVFERIRAAIEALEIIAGGERVPVTVSIGVTVNLCDSLEAMIKRSDEAVYEAKRTGRNRVVHV